jgi:hypothetical protein
MTSFCKTFSKNTPLGCKKQGYLATHMSYIYKYTPIFSLFFSLKQHIWWLWSVIPPYMGDKSVFEVKKSIFNCQKPLKNAPRTQKTGVFSGGVLGTESGNLP